MLVEDRNRNSLRAAIRRQNLERFNPKKIEEILEKRVFFRFLPVSYITDMEQGALWWIAASVIAILIPVFPLVSLYDGWFKDEHDDRLIVPRPDDTAVYAMLVFVGICYTIGSVLFHRAVRVPALAPLFSWKHIQTDELHAMWWFFFGTLPSVPITAIYCYRNGAVGQYGLALAISIIASICMELAVFASYPTEGHVHREWFAPIVHYFFPPHTLIGQYLSNDWLIICWAFLAVAVISDVMAFIILMYYCGRYDTSHNNTGAVGSEIYNFGTGLFDSLLFTVGCMYMLSGSTFRRISSDTPEGLDVEKANPVADGSGIYIDAITLSDTNIPQPAHPQERVRKPQPNEQLSVLLMHGTSTNGSSHGSSGNNNFRPGQIQKDSPPSSGRGSLTQEIVDDIPPPEDGPAVTPVAGTNRYSLALTKTEYTL